MSEIRKKTELLAPARDLDTGIAAINAGADAVYIGAASFGARHAASNNLEDIKKLVDYAHKFNVKIHVTINTILTDEELNKAKELIDKLYKMGVDAIIVQDMGLINLAIENKLPPIVLHASTQCNNRELSKVKFFEKTGISRVILARELSLEQIKEICANTNIEIETFVHGALCVSYSGQCYLSYANGGRSANRGECAQPCRKKYSLIDDEGNIIAKDKHLLSLKDFNASNYLEELVKCGVKSFKIEGRLKDKNYVKNVVSFYRQKLDEISEKTSSGKIFSDFEPDVNKSFNRGFTSYFLKNRENCFNFFTPKMLGEKLGKVISSGSGWFELDNKVNINSQDGLSFFVGDELSGCLVNKFQENKRVFINKKLRIPQGTVIYRNLDFQYEKVLSSSKITRKLGVTFEYSNGCLKAVDEDFMSVETEIPFKEKAKNPEKMKETFISQLAKTGESCFYVKEIKINGEVPFMPVSEINRLRRDILNTLIDKRLYFYKPEIQPSLHYEKYVKNTADYHENISNREAENFYKRCGCKVLERAVECGNSFSDKELMRTKHCLKYAFNMCKSSKNLFLVDEKGKKYSLRFDCKNCEMIVTT